MKKKTKDILVEVGATALTCGTSVMAGWGAMSATVLLMDKVLIKGVPKAVAHGMLGTITVGSLGVSYLVGMHTHEKFEGFLQEVLDIFPTEYEEEKDDNT